MKKNTMKFVLVGMLMIFLAGCFNISQHISKDGNKLNVFIKFTISKSIFELSNSMGGNQSNDNPCEGIMEFNEQEVINGFPKGIDADYKKVDTELECGYEMTMKLDTASKDYKKMKKEDAPAFFPLFKNDEIYIVFPKEEDDDEDQMEAAFMGTAMYRLTINRNVLDDIHSVTLSNAEESHDIEFIELPDLFIIEVPLAFWIASSSKCTLIIK